MSLSDDKERRKNIMEIVEVKVADRLKQRKFNCLGEMRLKIDHETKTIKITNNGDFGVTYDRVETIEDVLDCLKDYIIHEAN
jgi:hypothetical protein